MNLYKNILFILLLCVEICFSQSLPGARQVALSHADVSYSGDSFSLFNNPAGISLIQQREIGLYYSPSPFGVSEMANAYGAYVEPSVYGNFSAGFSIYGYELYKQTQIAFGYARKVYGNFYVGATAIYHNYSIKNYGSEGTLSFNIGGIANINEQLGFGFAIENLTRSTVSNESNQIPTVFWGGVHFRIIKEFILSTALSKEIGFNPSLYLGAEYLVMENICLRFGTHNEPNTYSGGFGVLYKYFQFDYAFTKHTDLGIDHQFGVLIRFNK